VQLQPRLTIQEEDDLLRGKAGAFHFSRCRRC
jgi:hypothetical protein